MSNTAVLAYIVLSIAIGYAFLMPNYDELSILQEEKQKYALSLEKVNNIENKKTELLTKFNNISVPDRKNIDTLLPDSFNFVRLVSQIDSVGMNYGISIDKVTSRILDPAVGDSMATTDVQKPYQSAIIGFSFTGSYERFGDFITALEDSLRILDIRSIRLSSTDTGSYNYIVEFETYWLKSN